MRNYLDIIIERLKKTELESNTVCTEYWRKIADLKENFNEKDFWYLLTNNIEWLINTKTITTNELIRWFTPEELNANNIFIAGEHKIKNGFAIGIAEAKIEASGHSRIILFDNAHCEAFDTTFVTGFNDSSMDLKNCVGEAFNNCKVIAKDFAKVEAWDNAIVKAESYSCIMAHDKVQVENTYHSHTVIV